MRTSFAAVILAAVSPIAIAQDTGTPPDRQAVSTTEQEAMAGESVEGPLASEIETLVLDDTLERILSENVQSSVIEAARRAYASSVFEPVWTREGAEALKDISGDLSEFGLERDDILQADIDALIEDRFSGDSHSSRARADLALTADWVRIAAAVSGGLTEEGEAAQSQKSAASYSLVPEKLRQAGKGDARDTIRAFEPTNMQYVRLKRTLEDYRDLEDEGGWLAMPDGDVIEEGDTDPRVPAIRERLMAEGYDADRSAFGLVSAVVDSGWLEAMTEDVSGDDTTDQPANAAFMDDNYYGSDLAAAVKAFQKRHGIKVDGVFGPGTRDALNESVESKIDRIRQSMDRWRKLEPMGERFIWVNIPSYTAEGWKDGEQQIVSKTIVGKPRHETPTFSDEIEYAIANPRWYVPSSITNEETAPKLAEDPGYAARNNLMVQDRETEEIVSPRSVNWNRPDVGEDYRLIQKPGPGNALGELKLMFPNQYAIYLHDTPADHLFDNEQRAFSHGCIRLEKPIEMGRWIAGMDSTTEPDRLSSTVREGDDRTRFDFKTPVPVHITYMTVTVDQDGEARFWRDIYGRTDGLRQAEEVASPDEAA